MVSKSKVLFFILGLTFIYLVLLLRLGTYYQLRVVFDDYFYYQRIASNFLNGLGITYDGVIRTNGFQPLWQIIVVLFVVLSHVISVDDTFFAIAANFICFSWGIVYLAKNYLKTFRSFEASLVITASIASYFFSPLGMEVGLLFLISCYAIPYLILSKSLDSKAALLLFLTFLTRIDVCLYFFPFLIYSIFDQKTSKKIAFFGLGGTLILIYFLVNDWYFHSFLPVSGLAKAVLYFSGFHDRPFYFVDPLLKIIPILLFIQTMVCIKYSSNNRKFVLISLIGIIFYYLVSSFTSNWPFSPWYVFPFSLHIIVLMVASKEINFPNPSPWTKVLFAFSCLVLTMPVMIAFETTVLPENKRFDNAITLKKLFLNDPAAIIAMGDGAGLVGRLVPNRLIQLEGLVMDRDYLDRLKNSKDIVLLLKHYRVKYYIASYPKKIGKDCYVVSEPWLSSGFSRKVTSTICAKVIAKGSWGDNSDVLVFKLT